MDVDTALETVRQAIDWLGREFGGDESPHFDRSGDVAHVVAELVESFQGLDKWLKDGGYLPSPWQHQLWERGAD